MTVDLVLNATFLNDADKEAILSSNLMSCCDQLSDGACMTRRTLLGGMVTAIATMAQPAWARQASSFRGRNAGDARKVDAIDLCWCPAGRFVMGSPRREPERRPGEDQVEVTLTQASGWRSTRPRKGSGNVWWGSCRAVTAELPAGDDLPVGNVNFAEAEPFAAS